MKNTITVLGSNNMFGTNPGNFQSAFVFHGRESLFIECGYDFLAALEYEKIDTAAVVNIYVSHTRHDCTAGLIPFGLLMYQKIVGHTIRPNLYAVPEVLRALQEMTREPLLAVLKNIPGLRENSMALKNPLEACFKLIPVDPKKDEWFPLGDTIQCSPLLIRQPKGRGMPNGNGLIIRINDAEEKEKFVFYSSNFYDEKTFDAPYQVSDVILQSCSLDSDPYPFRPDIVELATLPQHIREKMIPYGFGKHEPEQLKGYGFRKIPQLGTVIEI